MHACMQCNVCIACMLVSLPQLHGGRALTQARAAPALRSRLPAPAAHQDIVASGGRLVQIPIVHDLVRSLNLSVCVGVGVFEALRQLDTGRHAVAPRDDARSPMVRLPTPLMAAAAAGAGQQQLVQAEPAAAAVGARRPQGA